MTHLTPARRRGLGVLADNDPHWVRESNVTDPARGYVYWQTVLWLIDEGLAYYPSGSTMVCLTDAGRALAKEA